MNLLLNAAAAALTATLASGAALAQTDTALPLMASTTMSLTSAAATAGAVTVYDGLTGATPTFTGSTPRTYMGQGFSLADPGGPVLISSMQIGLVAGGAVNFQNTRINVALWDGFDPTSTTGVFSNLAQLASFTTGPISTTGATIYTFTLDFATPVALSGLSNKGLAVNWQSDATGTGSFIDNTLLTSALRTTGSAAINPGSNLNTSSGYFRNASGATNFNFLASDARSLTGVTNGGLMFSLAAVSAVPEPGTWLLMALGLGAVALRRRQR